jgi:cytochrome P450
MYREHTSMSATLDRTRLRSLFDLSSEVYASRGGAFDVDPYPIFNGLRESGPVHPGTPHEALGWTGDVFFQGLPYANRPHFSAYDYATCTRILRDETCFVTSAKPMPGEPLMPDAAILFMDGRVHHTHRTLVQPSFVPRRATWWLDNYIGKIVTTLIDGFAQDESIDLNLEFNSVIPLLTITGSFGISVEDALDVRAAVTADSHRNDLLVNLLFPIIAERRRQPADDLITVLVEAELTDEDGTAHRLTDIEILAFAFLLLAAGSGTTWKQMGITTLALLQRPVLLAAVREDRSLLRGVIEESVRWMPTDPVFARFVAKDCELAGVQLPAGAVVHAVLAAANRDPSRWEHPDEFDPSRPAKTHLGFGHGPHTCLGMHVARAELYHGISALLDRFPDMALDPAAPAPRIVGLYERGPDRVPVRLQGPS